MARKKIQKEFEFEVPRPIAQRATIALLTVDEIWKNLDEELLVRLNEDSRIERKSCRIGARDLAETICMWANTPPDGGLIVVGQKDRSKGGGFEGCLGMDSASLNNLENAGYDYCPSSKYEVRKVAVRNTKGSEDFAIVFRVQYHQTKVVEMTNSLSYWRKGDRQVALHGEEKRLLQIDKGQVPWEQEPCGLVWPTAFQMRGGIYEFVELVKTSTGITRDDIKVRHVLANHKLGVNKGSDFIPNNACALLFAQDTRDVCPGCMIRFQRFDGTTQLTGAKRNVVHDVEFRGNVPTILLDFTKFFVKQVREFSQLTSSGKFITLPEYPQEVWYEAIVNACVHRSYALSGMNIFVRMFDDRLEVESPGGFPPLVNPENIYYTHHRRNYFLMDAMKLMGYVRCENEGVKRMRDLMNEAGLPPPVFEQKELSNSVVRVTLMNNFKVRTRIGSELDAKLSQKQRILLAACIDHGTINVSDAMRLLNITNWSAAKAELESLLKMGLLDFVSRHSRDNQAHYVLHI